jgi:hypothetical protein
MSNNTNTKFITQEVTGVEATVRGYFAARDMNTPASQTHFPGVRAVAILPSEFSDQAAATTYLEDLLEPGDNAAAVRIGENKWLIAAWTVID